MNVRSALLALLCTGVAIAADGDQSKKAEEAALFGDLPPVEAASLHAQSMADAPANVTVITAEEIRRYGCRTLGDALASVRGFYVTYDHTYHYVGLRGISLPGDFNTRFLVMLNGHPLTENIYNSNGFFGQDFGLDMDLIERIEIIRGPTSALYGSNGMLANINIVTRSPVDSGRLGIASEVDSAGERKASIAMARHLGGGANLLVSGSGFDSRGLGGAYSHSDGERGYHSFVNLIWRGWSFTAFFNARDKQPPVGIGTSLAGDSDQHVMDSRSFVSASYKHRAGVGELQWRIAYDRYRYQDRYDYSEAGGVEPVRDFNRGDWLDTQFSYEIPLGGAGPLTIGVQAAWELRALQFNLADGSKQVIDGRPDRSAALFAQQQWNVSPRWKLYAGIRAEESRNYRFFASPRVAAVFQPSARNSYKFVYARPFRNPSAFEQFYDDGSLSYAAAPTLRREVANTFEASFERQVGRGVALIVNGFHYRIADVIESMSLENGVQQYGNQGRIRSTGVEFEVRGKAWGRLEASASSSIQDAVGGQPWQWLGNSPHVLSKARLGVPIYRDRFFFAGAIEHTSARTTNAADPLGGFLLADFTVTARLHPKFDLQAGVRNALDRRYDDPVSLTLDRLPGDGRSVYVRLVWRVWE